MQCRDVVCNLINERHRTMSTSSIDETIFSIKESLAMQ